MSQTIHREILFPKPPEAVWKSLASSAALREWLYPNDFEPRVGHQFTFEVPPKPEVGFEGLCVHCEVLQCDEPNRLVFSWEGGHLSGRRSVSSLSGKGAARGCYLSIPDSILQNRLGNKLFREQSMDGQKCSTSSPK